MPHLEHVARDIPSSRKNPIGRDNGVLPSKIFKSVDFPDISEGFHNRPVLQNTRVIYNSLNRLRAAGRRRTGITPPTSQSRAFL